MEDEWIKDGEDYFMLLKFVKVVYVANMLWFVDLHRVIYGCGVFELRVLVIATMLQDCVRESS